MTKKTKFILAIVLQVAIIFTIIIFKMAILSGGTDVMLQIKPVDPRDLLRGDYITFKYDNISNVSPYFFKKEQVKESGTVYVTLRKSGKYWTIQSAQKTKPIDGELFIKGHIVYGGIGNSPSVLGASNIHIIYGIEDYFIPEGKGRGFSFWNKKAAAKVAIDKNGNAVLKQIYIEGNPWP